MFEKALRLKLRFSYNGLISVEDLWDLSLTALDAIYKQLSAGLQALNQDSLLQKRTKETDLAELRLEIVKHVFMTKQAEAAARADVAEKRAKKQKLMELVAEKQDEVLKGKSVDDLNALIAELD